ncbi:protein disulfide-isomerase A5 isoform X1 [Tachypleus tridentatus]|uniref:protein disulfide-isomerase A5 isoform X1 n=1 Tax=Tachypleus tridentatus TaxID=6853 RepID=UPI003FD013A4
MSRKRVVLLVMLTFLPIVLNTVSKNDARKEFEIIQKTEKYLLILFSMPCCSCVECVEAEALLTSIHPELDEALGVKVVKLTDQTDLEREYGIKKKPSLLFLREKIPSLYDGEFETSALFHWIGTNKNPAVKYLDDTSFEHLTQAATGATTGDWLTVFTDLTCEKGQALLAILEATAGSLKGRVNVAKINKEKSPELVERFHVTKCPEILFFHHGKMYSYNLDKIDISSLKIFGEGWYKNSKAVPVPVQKTYFDRMTEGIANYLKAKQLGGVALVVAAVIVVLTFVWLWKDKSSDKGTKKD